jgi:hypothetical protein
MVQRKMAAEYVSLRAQAGRRTYDNRVIAAQGMHKFCIAERFTTFDSG